MTRHPSTMHRVLAIDPSSRGLGFAVLEDPCRLIDWGVKRLRSSNPRAARIAAAVQLLRWYEPDHLMIEDHRARGARRRPRIRHVLDDLAELADRRGLTCVRVAWTTARRTCGGSPSATREQIAAALATMFPELARCLPPHRKPWMSEDARLSLFDAVVLAVTSPLRRERRRRAQA